MRTSAIHAAINAAVGLFAAESGLSRVDVVDGPPFEWNPLRPVEQNGDGRRFLFIGANPDSEDNDSATGNQEFGGTGGAARSRDERFSISCVGLVLDGGQNVSGCRADLFAMLTVVENVLLARPDLGDGDGDGPVLYSEFGGVDKLKQFFDDGGLTISVQFEIRCRAYLTS